MASDFTGDCERNLFFSDAVSAKSADNSKLDLTMNPASTAIDENRSGVRESSIIWRLDNQQPFGWRALNRNHPTGDFPIVATERSANDRSADVVTLSCEPCEFAVIKN